MCDSFISLPNASDVAGLEHLGATHGAIVLGDHMAGAGAHRIGQIGLVRAELLDANIA